MDCLPCTARTNQHSKPKSEDPTKPIHFFSYSVPYYQTGHRKFPFFPQTLTGKTCPRISLQFPPSEPCSPDCHLPEPPPLLFFPPLLIGVPHCDIVLRTKKLVALQKKKRWNINSSRKLLQIESGLSVVFFKLP